MDARGWGRGGGGGVGSLSHHLSRFDTDSEAELVTGMRKAVDQSLELFLSVCRQDSVFGKKASLMATYLTLISARSLVEQACRRIECADRLRIRSR